MRYTESNGDMKSRLFVLPACCVASFLAGVMIFGYQGVMAHYWRTSLGASRADVGLIMFYVLAFAGVGMMVVGRMQEKIALGWLAAAGALICGGAAFLVDHAEHIRTVYLWAALTGAASAFVYLPTITAAQLHYPERKGLTSGLVSMFFGISGAATAPLFGHLLGRMGYGPMTRLMGWLILGIGLLAAIFIRAPRIQRPAAGGAGAVPGLASLTAAESMRTRSFWLLWLTWAFAGAAGIAMVSLSVTLGIERGLTMSHAVLLLTAFSITNGLSRLISGQLSDLIGPKKTMSATFLLAGAAYFLFPHVEGVVLLAILAGVIGFALGTLFAASAPFVGECFGMAHFGAIFGLIFTAYGFVAGLLGSWFSGYLLDATSGNYTLVLGFLGTLMILSAIMVRIATPANECVLPPET